MFSLLNRVMPAPVLDKALLNAKNIENQNSWQDWSWTKI
jgi:hypothetical protein